MKSCSKSGRLLYIFTCSHLHILTCSHTHIFSSSHPHIFTDSHLHRLTPSHTYIFTSSHTYIFTSSHPHKCTSSHIFTHLHTSSLSLSPSHIFSLSLSVSLTLHLHIFTSKLLVFFAVCVLQKMSLNSGNLRLEKPVRGFCRPFLPWYLEVPNPSESSWTNSSLTLPARRGKMGNFRSLQCCEKFPSVRL